MTENDDQQDLTDADIAALLAEARVTDPIPSDVAARLDATLADLTADRAADRAADGDAPVAPDDVVVPLRPRRSLGPRLLVAAAAIVVVGAGAVGLNQVLGGKDSTLSSSTAAGPAAGSTARPNALHPTAKGQDFAPMEVGVPEFTTASFSDDAATFVSDTSIPMSLDSLKHVNGSKGSEPPVFNGPLQPATPRASVRYEDNSGGTASGSGTTNGGTGTSGGAGAPAGGVNAPEPAAGAPVEVAPCDGPADPAGTATQITLDGKPAVLVVGPIKDGKQLVQAWSCDGSGPLASATVTR